MRRLSAVVLAVGLSVGFGHAGYAADMPVKAPPPAPAVASSWNGCYVGAAGGGIWGRSQLYDLTLNAVLTDPFDLSGVIIGGTLGCNLQVDPKFVIGLEGDGSWTNKDGTGKNINNSTKNEVSERWFATLRGRVGFVVNNWLIYGTGGAAFVGTKLEVIGNGGTFSQTLSRTGWTAGGGVEVAFAPHWSAKLEYLHADFGEADYVDLPQPPVDHRRVSLTDDILRVGVNFKFASW